MKRVQFATHIQASPAVVWETLIQQESFCIWTSAFMEGSYYEGSWEQGQPIRFLSPGGNGVSSVIAENRPHEWISIKHIGEIKAGVEDTTSEAVRAWAPCFENYAFVPSGDGTELKAEMDVLPEYEAFMQEAWPKALAKLKELCELA